MDSTAIGNMEFASHKECSYLYFNISSVLRVVVRLVALDQDLLFLLKLINEFDRHLQDTGNDIRRRQCQPLGERNVGDAITLVDFNPLKSLRLRCVFNVVTCITS